MRGVWWFLGAALALVLIPSMIWAGLALVFLFGPRVPSDLERRHDQLREGMSIDEVRGVLGPETRETTEGECTTHRDGAVVPCVRGDRVLVWERDGRLVRAGFVGGVLVSKDFFEYDL